MIILLSPAKKQSLAQSPIELPLTAPRMLEKTQQLRDRLNKMSAKQLQELLGISSNLTELNRDRFRDYDPDRFFPPHAAPALFMYQGDAYQQLDAATLSEEDCRFAQDHLRIVSAFYGLLRPLDLIQPYRLEMTTPSFIHHCKSLKLYWRKEVSEQLIEDARAIDTDTILNCASKAYSEVMDRAVLASAGIRVVDCDFKEQRGVRFQTIGLFAKKGRGLMARYGIQRHVHTARETHRFQEGGYHFNAELSQENNWVFTRDSQAE